MIFGDIRAAFVIRNIDIHALKNYIIGPEKNSEKSEIKPTTSVLILPVPNLTVSKPPRIAARQTCILTLFGQVKLLCSVVTIFVNTLFSPVKAGVDHKHTARMWPA